MSLNSENQGIHPPSNLFLTFIEFKDQNLSITKGDNNTASSILNTFEDDERCPPTKASLSELRNIVQKLDLPKTHPEFNNHGRGNSFSSIRM